MPLPTSRPPARAYGLCAAALVVATSCSSSQTSAGAAPAPSAPAAPAPAAPASEPKPAPPAPAPAPPANLTTKAGVYTADQAGYGKNVFMGACVSCHSPGDYQGGAFYAGLVGTSVGKLFTYLRENMPQDNPGALADEDYLATIAYILQLNSAPTGAKPLPADSTALSKITFADPSTPPHHFSTGR